MTNLLLTFSLVLAMYYGNITKGPEEIGRIGILLSSHKVIDAVYVGSPADEAGLEPGDVIKFVNGDDILGPPGTEIGLTIMRNGATFNVVVIRRAWSQVDTKHEKRKSDHENQSSPQNRIHRRSDDWQEAPQLS